MTVQNWYQASILESIRPSVTQAKFLMEWVHVEIDVKKCVARWVHMDGLGLDGPWPAHKQNPFLPIGKWEEQLKKE